MRYFGVILMVMFCFVTGTAQAAADEAAILNQVFSASKQEEPQVAKSYLTSGSHGLYDRIYKHKLTFLLPENVNEVRSNNKNGFKYVQFTDPVKAAGQSVIVAFQQEDGATKMDLPETFRIGFGENWQQKLDMIEQTYNYTRQYYGEAETVAMLKGLMQKSK